MATISTSKGSAKFALFFGKPSLSRESPPVSVPCGTVDESGPRNLVFDFCSIVVTFQERRDSRSFSFHPTPTPEHLTSKDEIEYLGYVEINELKSRETDGAAKVKQLCQRQDIS